MISNEFANFLFPVFDHSPIGFVLGFVSAILISIPGARNGCPVSGFASKVA